MRQLALYGCSAMKMSFLNKVQIVNEETSIAQSPLTTTAGGSGRASIKKASGMFAFGGKVELRRAAS